MGRSGGSSLGMAALVIAMAIVLILTARAWRAMGTTAVDINTAAPGIVDDRGEAEAGDAVRQGQLPDLQETRRETDAHAERLSDALAEIE